MESVDVALEELSSSLVAEFQKVTGALQERSNLLRQEKCDLERHLAMVIIMASLRARRMLCCSDFGFDLSFQLEFQVGQTDESYVLLQKAIHDKKRAASVTEGQLKLHVARPQSELCADEVQAVLLKELSDAKRDLQVLAAKLPQLDKTLRSLRRSKLDVASGIEQKMKCIEMEEAKCLSIRAAMDTIKL